MRHISFHDMPVYCEIMIITFFHRMSLSACKGYEKLLLKYAKMIFKKKITAGE